MTPAERARMIERQEFEAERKALLRRTSQYVEQRRAADKARVDRWIAREAPQIAIRRSGPQQTKLYTSNGEAKSLTEWSQIAGVSHEVFIKRLRSGMDIEHAVAKKPANRLQHHVISGVSKTLEEWADDIGITKDALVGRMSKGRTLAEALAMPAGRWPNNRGVASVLGAFEGTGGGSTAQEIPEITFSEKAENA